MIREADGDGDGQIDFKGASSSYASLRRPLTEDLSRRVFKGMQAISKRRENSPFHR